MTVRQMYIMHNEGTLQELTFITSLVTKLRQCPELLSLFAHESKPGDSSHTSSQRSSKASSMVDISHIEELTLPGTLWVTLSISVRRDEVESSCLDKKNGESY